MCGGEGTRLRPLTFERPKPCIPIVNIPSIRHLVTHLTNLGFTDIIITLGYKGTEIEDALGDGSLCGAEITYVYDRIKLGTAGSVKNAQEYLKGQPFLVVGGDHICDLNLLEFYREHMKGDAITSIGLVSIEDPSEYGIAQIDVTNRILRFKEKPSPGEIFSNLASTGMYVCNPEIFDYIPENEKFDFAKDLFPLLMEKGYRLNGWLGRGHWTDVGSPGMLRQAEKWKLNELSNTSIRGDLYVKGANIQGPVQFGSSISLGSNSRIVGPVSIGSGTIIEENVLIGPYTSIGENCTIRADTQIFSSSLYNRVLVGERSVISGSIIDDDVNIGTNCSLENNTVFGPRVILHNNVVVHSGTKIWPECTVPDNVILKEHLLNEKYDINCEGS